MSIVNIEKRLVGTSRCYYSLVIKKYIDAFFSANPIFFLFFTTIVFCVLATKNELRYFLFIAIPLVFCLVVALYGFIDSLLSRFRKPVAWSIGFVATLGLFYFIRLSNDFFSRNELFDTVYMVLYLVIFMSLLIYLFITPIKGIFGLIKKLKWKVAKKFVTFVEGLLDPLYMFPIKLVTYSAYYLIKLLIRTSVEMFRLLIDLVCFPFKGFRNLVKSIVVVFLTLYVVASLFVIVDYIRTQYGYYGKFFCSYGTSEKLKKSVVRVVGGYSEGTGFFISENQVLTNFHVIAGEPSPKIIFPDGNFITPTKITGDSGADLAILFTESNYADLVMPLPDEVIIKDEEPLLATGYAMGTDLVGKATVLRGNFVDFRNSKYETVEYIQTSISLVEGMSGGPLTDQCGQVVGVNTQGLAGLSLFISADEAKKIIPNFSDQEIEKIEVDASKSPEDAVFAFYTYLKARRMKDGFDLLSSEYLQKTNFEEWTNRFTDILDVTIFKSERLENSKDTAEVKFVTKNWVNQETDFHFYEGTWQTVLEDGKYKMLKSNIKEVEDPDYYWFYE